MADDIEATDSKRVNFVLGGDADRNPVYIEVADLADNPSHGNFDPLLNSASANDNADDADMGITFAITHNGQPVMEEVTSPDVDREKPHDLFVELYDLLYGDDGVEWQETGRWIKYEEDVEGVDHHFGRPHVGFLSFHSLIQFRRCVSKGATMLDCSFPTFPSIVYAMADTMITELKMETHLKERICEILLVNHRLGIDQRTLRETYTSLRLTSVAASNVDYSLDSPSVSRVTSRAPPRKRSAPAPGPFRNLISRMQGSIVGMGNVDRLELPIANRKSSFRRNPSATSMSRNTTCESLLKKIMPNAEACQVFVGIVPELSRVQCVFVRLKETVEVQNNRIRFIIVLIGPVLPDVNYHELGRSISTLMSNNAFRDVAYSATTKLHLLCALDKFLDASIVIPPGEIPKPSLLTVHDIQKALRQRMANIEKQNTTHSVEQQIRNMKENRVRNRRSSSSCSNNSRIDPLIRSGYPFRGTFNEVIFRFPQYWSDLRDGIHFQCVTSLLFMFFAVFAPAIAFGELLGAKTGNLMGVSETLVSQAVTGVLWGLTSAQPLIVVAATGPVVIFESSLFEFCKANEIEFLVFRVWIGFWIAIFAFLTVALEGSFLVRCVTRFSEDVFALLISFIFIVESLKYMLKNFLYNHPLQTLDSYCAPDNISYNNWSLSTDNDKVTNQPDTALFSAVLLLLTFYIAFYLKRLRNSHFLGRTMRRALGDFGIPIAILLVCLLAKLCCGTTTYLEHLRISDTFGVTAPEKRGWFISPMGINKPLPVWLPPAAIVPAFLVYILIFVETEITEFIFSFVLSLVTKSVPYRLLLSKPERCLTKGTGFHLDILIIGLLSVLSSLFGLPWMCAAAVQSLAHVSSLTVMKRHLPGEKPTIDYVLEQRVTGIGVAILTGASVFMGSVLRTIPVAVLFGVFLYLGIMNMQGSDLIHRFILFFIPEKYYPDVPYCTKVHMFRMHFYTILQIVCLIIVWLFKSFRASAVAFPFVLMIIAMMRMFLLPKIFTKVEIEALDGEETELEFEDDQEIDFYEQARGMGL